MGYFDFVICKDRTGKEGLYRAPAFSGLRKKDVVALEDSRLAFVISCITVSETDLDQIDFIMNAASAAECPKIAARVVFHDFEYKEENHG